MRAREAGEVTIAQGLAVLEASLGTAVAGMAGEAHSSDDGGGSDGGGGNEEEEDGGLDDSGDGRAGGGDTPDQSGGGSETTSPGQQGRMSNDRSGKGKRKRDRIPLSSLTAAQTPNRVAWSYPDEATLNQCAPPMSAEDRVRVWLQSKR